MVIKYAMGEKDILIARKSKEAAEKKFNDANKDKEGLQYKIKTLSNERTRLQGLCDVRGQETLAAKREGDKLREEVRLLEGKHTQTLNKLKTETESHDQTRESLNTTFKQLCNLQSSIDEMKAEAEEVIRVAKAEGEEVKK